MNYFPDMICCVILEYAIRKPSRLEMYHAFDTLVEKTFWSKYGKIFGIERCYLCPLNYDKFYVEKKNSLLDSVLYFYDNYEDDVKLQENINMSIGQHNKCIQKEIQKLSWK